MLARMLALGFSPVEATAALETVAGSYRSDLRRLHGALDQGQPLPELPSLLPPELPALLHAGQRSGQLTEVMERASRYLVALHGAIRTTLLPLFYPLLLLWVLALVSFSLRRALQPVAGGELGALAVFGSLPFVVGVVASVAILGYWIRWRRRPTSRANVITRLTEAVLRRVPGIRPLLEQPALAVSAGSLAVTLRAGVDGAEALRIAADGCRSGRLRDALLGAGRAMAVGAPFERAMARPDLPEALRAAATMLHEADRPLALEAAAQAALRRLEAQARRVSVVAFSVALLLAAACVGLMASHTYGVLISVPGGIG
jgi:type II secretory pathway component PulF